jgi:hypothetical protein
MRNRTPRFISQFAALQSERRGRPHRRWPQVILIVLLAAAAALAIYDMLR